MKKTNGVERGIRSPNPYNIQRRAKRANVSVDELLEREKFEQNLIDQGYFFCNDCGQWKKEDTLQKVQYFCSDCYARRARANYDNRKQRSYLLMKKYGISFEQYITIKENQNYRCAICGIDESKLDRGLAVDHDHITGKIRGLLCNKCNRFLGCINDDISIAKRLLSYLETNKI
jgi:hypothetical protein